MFCLFLFISRIPIYNVSVETAQPLLSAFYSNPIPVFSTQGRPIGTALPVGESLLGAIVTVLKHCDSVVTESNHRL